MNRKQWKKSAKQSVKSHYLMFVFLCLFIAMLGLDFGDSLSPIKAAVNGKDAMYQIKEFWETDAGENTAPEEKSYFDKVYDSLIQGKWLEGRQIAENEMDNLSKTERHLGMISIGHSRGVLSSLVNMTASGEILNLFADAIRSIMNSDASAMIVFILLSGIFMAFIRIYIFHVIHVAYKRFFMEARIYEKIPATRFLLFIRMKRWGKVALAMLRLEIFQFLWGITIIGGIIKSYSYFMVPYILAENPYVSGKEAIALSKKMMKGHKWECFILKFSFIGWDFLTFFSLGLSGIFFSNAYQEASYAEYYAYIRGLAIENGIPGSERLNDQYLYCKADAELLEKAYRGAVDPSPYPALRKDQKHPIRQFIRDTFGVVLTIDEEERKYEQITQRQEREREYRAIMAKEQYPLRLHSEAANWKTRKMGNFSYLRHYSLVSIILMFFTFSIVGWLWEVNLHLVIDGVFVNRGIMHGPWLPIYGFGGVFILIVLNKLRKNPIIQFVSAVILCGCLEYFTSWYLEVTQNGKKWWDYSGYFLNINGRICAEGLLVFGLGGIAIVYLLAPALDNHFRKIPFKIAVSICAVLLTIYATDQIYSQKHPNEGKGITDYAAQNTLTDTQSAAILIGKYQIR